MKPALRAFRCVDALLELGLKGVKLTNFRAVDYNLKRRVDSAAESLTGQGLLDELPTDWVKSD
ncbi:MAG: hypothetical protein SW833_04415 [Cyanobacteriota bacterium]|nr:hypothetical protein [Cyanobacteriota bacterium]